MLSNSKFPEFETVRTLKIQKTTKLGPQKFPRINDYEKPRKKEEKKNIISNKNHNR